MSMASFETNAMSSHDQQNGSQNMNMELSEEDCQPKPRPARQHTNYRFVDLTKADFLFLFGYGLKYNIKFQASTSDEKEDFFLAKVSVKDIQRGVKSLGVDCVRIEKPGSDWQHGKLFELAAIDKKKRVCNMELDETS